MNITIVIMNIYYELQKKLHTINLKLKLKIESKPILNN